MLTVLTDSQRVDAVRARGAGVRGSATIILKRSNLRRMVRMDEDLVEDEKGGDDKEAGMMESMTLESSYDEGQT